MKRSLKTIFFPPVFFVIVSVWNLTVCEIPDARLLITNAKWSDLIFSVLLNPNHLCTPAAMPHPHPELPTTLTFGSNNPPYQQFSRLRCRLLASLILAKLPFHFQFPSRLLQYSRVPCISLWASQKKAGVTPLMLLFSHLSFSLSLFLSFAPQPELVEA